MAVLVLCIGFGLTLPSSPARGSQEDPSTLGIANIPPVPREPVNAPPLDGSYSPFALAEEADQDPVNTGLLTMLLLAASFLGANLGWLLPNARG